MESSDIGVPQGSLISPLLANMYFDKLDKFVEENLILTYNKGVRRSENLEYKRAR